MLTDAFHADPALGRDRSLYKFIWVRSGTLRLEIDHVETTLEAGEVVPLTPLHRIAVREVAGDYLTLLFNSNFYCIYGHDDEVSCNGCFSTAARKRYGCGPMRRERPHCTKSQTSWQASTRSKTACAKRCCASCSSASSSPAPGWRGNGSP